MANITITMPDEMHDGLTQASEAEERAISAVMRRAIAEYLLKHHNITVPHTMKWGGKRRGESTDDE